MKKNTESYKSQLVQFLLSVIALAFIFSPAFAGEKNPDNKENSSVKNSAMPAVEGFQLPEDTFKGTLLEVSKEEKQRSEQLNKRIQRILASIPDFSGISVQVTEGVVTLEGKVLRATVRDDAVKLVQSINGVTYVVNSIALETNVDKTLSPLWQKLEEYWSNFLAFSPLLLIATGVIVFFWYISGLVSAWEAPYRRFAVNPLLHSFIRQLVRAAFLAVGFLLAFTLIGATAFVSALLGTAGLVSFALGFALRDIIENYLAGIIMGFRQPFEPSDLVRIGDDEGKITRLTARELVLITYDGNHVTIPNATVFKSRIYNFSRNPTRRFDFFVGVDAREDLQHVQELGVDTLRNVNGIMADPGPYAYVDSLGDFNVLVRFYGWVDQRQAEFLKVRSQAIRLVKERFDQAGVLMPEPITTTRLQLLGVQDLPEPLTAPVHIHASGTQKTASEITQEAQYVDVSVDTTIDEQIAEEKARSDEKDLLKARPDSGQG